MKYKYDLKVMFKITMSLFHLYFHPYSKCVTQFKLVKSTVAQ